MHTRLRLLLVIAVIAATSACGDDSSAPRGSAVITLDIFSGMPNPMWAITPEEAADLLGMWNELDDAVVGEYPGHLGYRGVIVDFADGSTIWVSAGVAFDESTATARSDRDGTLETWIVNTGQATLDPALLSEVLSTITQG